LAAVTREKSLTGLIPASGDQDHTISPSASMRIAFAHQNVHRILILRPWRSRETPLLWIRTGRRIHLISHSEKEKFDSGKKNFSEGSSEILHAIDAAHENPRLMH
jgi:hypothetical protein